MAEKLIFLVPEITLFIGAVLVAVLGLSHSRRVRELLPLITCAFLAIAFFATPLTYGDAANRTLHTEQSLLSWLAPYVKMITCLVGALLVMVGVGRVDRKLEADVASGRQGFDPLRASRGEYYAFFLLSLIGVMLCSTANDLIWLFVALELTSLPTYIMVAMSRPSRKAHEAAMKYFFLGALAAAVFLMGFALLYGATGTMNLLEMRDIFAEQKLANNGAINIFGTVGAILTIVGLGYKVAAVPMQFYAADVYEGAASPVTAFLGFVPKLAGMAALILVLSTIGWATEFTDVTGQVSSYGLPPEILSTLWMIAVLTMTLGNIQALLQRSVKRMLGYSSIAHTGYLMIGLIAGPGLGLKAIMFYMLVYGLMNTGAFAVLAGLERQGREIENLDDLAGLRQKHPAMAWAMALCAGSLLGFPPLLGFIGKLMLFIAGVQANQVPLVVIAGLNSAISAWYYLQLVRGPILGDINPRSELVRASATRWPRVAALVGAIGVTAGTVFVQPLLGLLEAAGSDDPAAAGGANATPADDLSIPERITNVFDGDDEG